MPSPLAIDGGAPVRTQLLPYGRQAIGDDDVAAVVDVLRSDWLTTGPAVSRFERAFADCVGVREAVTVSSGTAALHAAVHAIGIGPGDEVIVPPITFAATANAVAYEGGTPMFADVDPATLLLDPAQAEARITPRTKAIIAVDYAGQPCDYDGLRGVADRHHLRLLADACHALGATYHGRRVGSLADISAFSFHPVKLIAAGEGGMLATDDADAARRMRTFRNHGITTDHRERERATAWFYEQVELGFNYRLSDIHCALGASQLQKLPGWITRRQQIAAAYRMAFSDVPGLRPLAIADDRSHAYHLFVIELDLARLTVDRRRIFAALRAEGIGVNVHYVPVHLHSFYRDRFGTGPGLCPVAEAAYERMLTLPLFHAMSNGDVADVIAAVHKVVGAYCR